MQQIDMAVPAKDIEELAARILQGDVKCNLREAQKDGDIRYWNVDPEQHPLLSAFKKQGELLYAAALGKKPEHAFIMMNDIEASRSPQGSGGGWHLDSFKSQYKFFMYLSDVNSDENGAFAYFPQTRSWWFRAYALVKRGLFRSVRYTNREANILRGIGADYVSVKGKKGTNFFLDTSYLHRGLPIKAGRRLLATLYIYDDMTEEMKTKMGALMGKF